MGSVHDIAYAADVLETLLLLLVKGDDAVDIGMIAVEGSDILVDDEVYLSFRKGELKAMAESHGEHGVAYAAKADDEDVADHVLVKISAI